MGNFFTQFDFGANLKCLLLISQSGNFCNRSKFRENCCQIIVIASHLQIQPGVYHLLMITTLDIHIQPGGIHMELSNSHI